MSMPESIKALAIRAPVAELPEPSERKRLRKAFGITQEQLSDALKVARQTVITWENGSRNPVGKKRAIYAELLNSWKIQLEQKEINHDQ